MYVRTERVSAEEARIPKPTERIIKMPGGRTRLDLKVD